MKIRKTTEILKKAAAMCKSKTARLLILASLQRCRMAAGPMVSKKIHTRIVADRNRVDCHKPLALRTIEKRPVIIHGGDLAANFSHQLTMFTQEDGNGGCPADWTLHPLFNDDHNNCCYTDDDDVLLDACDQEDDDELSVTDVIRSNREVEGLEFNMEEEIDMADLQQRPRQAGAATLEDNNFGGASRVLSLDSQGENPRSDLYWLYLAMALLKALFFLRELGLSLR